MLSWIVFKGSSNFFDRSFNRISLLYFAKKVIYKYTFKASPEIWDKYSVKKMSGKFVLENNKDKSLCSNFIKSPPKYLSNYIIKTNILQ